MWIFLRIENAGSKEGRQKVILPKTSLQGAAIGAATEMGGGCVCVCVGGEGRGGLTSGEGQHFVVGVHIGRSSQILDRNKEKEDGRDRLLLYIITS